MLAAARRVGDFRRRVVDVDLFSFEKLCYHELITFYFLQYWQKHQLWNRGPCDAAFDSQSFCDASLDVLYDCLHVVFHGLLLLYPLISAELFQLDVPHSEV